MTLMTERQEVAAKLRENSTAAHNAEEALRIICKCTIRTMKGSKGVMEVLADLIDPTCSIGYTDLTTDTPDGYDPDGYYYCSRCGELDSPFDETWDTYQAHNYEGEPPFRYCPHCGSRVVIPGV